jgi:hypothetical protein
MHDLFFPGEEIFGVGEPIVFDESFCPNDRVIYPNGSEYFVTGYE